MTVATAAPHHAVSHSDKENADLVSFIQSLPKRVQITVLQFSKHHDCLAQITPFLYLNVCHRLIYCRPGITFVCLQVT